ncbi:unnamed protein product, partial [Owenia fusiformis]
ECIRQEAGSKHDDIFCHTGRAIYIENVTHIRCDYDEYEYDYDYDCYCEETIPKEDWRNDLIYCNGNNHCELTAKSSFCISCIFCTGFEEICYKCYKSIRQCTGTNMTLACGSDHINMISVIHGIIEQCPNGEARCRIENVKRLGALKQICDGQAICNITATPIGRCRWVSHTKRNYEQILYECIPRQTTTRRRQQTSLGTTSLHTTDDSPTEEIVTRRGTTEDYQRTTARQASSVSTPNDGSTTITEDSPITSDEIKPDPTTDNESTLKQRGSEVIS